MTKKFPISRTALPCCQLNHCGPNLIPSQTYCPSTQQQNYSTTVSITSPHERVPAIQLNFLSFFFLLLLLFTLCKRWNYQGYRPSLYGHPGIFLPCATSDMASSKVSILSINTCCGSLCLSSPPFSPSPRLPVYPTLRPLISLKSIAGHFADLETSYIPIPSIFLQSTFGNKRPPTSSLADKLPHDQSESPHCGAPGASQKYNQ